MMIDLFTRAYVNREFRTARENILFELERAMFPETVPFVEQMMVKRKNTNMIIENNQLINRLLPSKRIFEMHGAGTELMREQIINLLEIRRLELENEILTAEIASPPRKDPPREFIKGCSRNGCNGFLSTAWKCRVCDLYTCKDCHEPKDDQHECNPDTVKSVEQIKSDSRPCPRCHSLIYKINGCDQMFCTSCHTPFSWRTGKIELGRVHNPHYYEYQRQRGQLNREIGDIQCGGMPDQYQLNWTTPEIRQFHRGLLEFQQYRLPGYIVGDVNAFQLNLTLRVNFMAKVISEATFKNEIYRKDKELAKKREIGMVATTFLQIMSDLYTRLVIDRERETFDIELAAAIEYSNSLFRDISRVYECIVPVITFPRIEYRKVR